MASKDETVFEEKVQADISITKVDEVANLNHDVEQQKYSPWTLSMWRLYGCLWIAYLCGCLNGYDGSLMGGINAMESYQRAFGL